MLGEILDKIREYYLRRFIDAIEEHASQEGISVAHEPAFSNADGDLVTEGELDLPLRGDLMLIRDGAVFDSIQVDTSGMLSFEPVSFQWPENDLHVELQPFQWNWMQLRLYGLTATPDWTPIRNWFLHWFGEDDPADGELLGGVHYLSDPEVVQDCFQLSLDLGTAPVESFEELLDAIGQTGATQVQIGQW